MNWVPLVITIGIVPVIFAVCVFAEIFAHSIGRGWHKGRQDAEIELFSKRKVKNVQEKEKA